MRKHRPPPSFRRLAAVTLLVVWLCAVLFVSFQILTLLFSRPAAASNQISSIPPQATGTPFLLGTLDPNTPLQSPTPDPPRQLPTLRTSVDQYTVKPNDTLSKIAMRYGVSLNALIQYNQIANPDLLTVGQVLSIPPQDATQISSFLKLIPDSELVYSPATVFFNVEEFIHSQKGYLAGYSEVVEGTTLSGRSIVLRVAQEYSVNPRLLLAVLEHQSGWVTQSNPAQNTLNYPVGYYETWRDGLYSQLAWTANELNRGYYLWKVNAYASISLTDGNTRLMPATINAGTAGVYYLFSKLYDTSGWEKTIAETGFLATYTRLFGYPFNYASEPLIPADLAQPPMQLPFENGVTWSYTGGPHGGWNDGSAWAALDFAPPGEPKGCLVTDDWVVAVADGKIIRSENGAVIQDLSNDGHEQTGWVVFYMHIATADRVKTGTYVKAGERIGHASCEGGVSYGAHLHIARKYNGEWIAADGDLPFNLDGWISSGAGIEYNGYLERNGEIIEAWNSFVPQNQIRR